MEHEEKSEEVRKEMRGEKWKGKKGRRTGNKADEKKRRGREEEENS